MAKDQAEDYAMSRLGNDWAKDQAEDQARNKARHETRQKTRQRASDLRRTGKKRQKAGM